MALSCHVWLPISWPGQGERERGHLKKKKKGGHERVFSPIMISSCIPGIFSSGFLLLSCTFSTKC